jgi:aspartyl-tRNA(Asn)/glutamyl-tRNA(Gln) amidotransferase subunit B
LSDDSEVDEVISKIISDNPEQVEKFKSDPRMLNWFVGQCMKAGKGKISPQIAKDKISDILERSK